MSKGINKFIGIGNVCQDPDNRALPNGDQVCNLTIACNDSYKNKTTGEVVDNTEFVKVVFFRKLAEIAGKYLKKGSKVYVEGKLKTRMWEKEGQKHYSTEIVGDNMQMLDSRGQSDQSSQQSSSNAPPADDFDDDIAF
jgi:single-strand DNA-binding protein